MTDELETFRQRVAEFLTASLDSGKACPAFGVILPPALHERARAWQRHMFNSGFAGLHWPKEFGGQGLSRDHTTIWTEECARFEVTPIINLQSIVLAGESIMRTGTQAQKERFLTPTLSAEILWCQLFSEPDAGSDLASLQTTADTVDDRFVINGQKVWTSNGQHAEFGILLARTGTKPKHRGISFFLLDMSLPGVEVRPLKQMTGDEEFCEVFLNNVEVGTDALLGPLNDGWRVSMEVLQDERGSSGAAGLISLQKRLDQLGALKGDDPILGAELVKILVRGHALKTLMMRIESDPAAGSAMASAAKLLGSELEFDARGLEANLRGPQAMLSGPTTERFLYSPGKKLAGGTSEIQRNIIGERLLGLPKEPRI